MRSRMSSLADQVYVYVRNIVLVFWYIVGTAVINNMLKSHDNMPHIKGIIATWVKHKCTGKLKVFIMAGGGRWRCCRLSPVCPRHRFSQKWQLRVCKWNFRVCKMPIFMKIPMKMKRNRIILGCAIGLVACAKHRCTGGWLKLWSACAYTRKVLSEHFCVDTFNRSLFDIPYSDPIWRRSDVEPAIFWLPKILSHV